MNRIPKNRTMTAWSESYPVNPVHPVQKKSLLAAALPRWGAMRLFSGPSISHKMEES